MKNKVFIIILNWNRKDDTLDCLDSLKDLTVENYHLYIIIVDNGSTDGSVKEFRKYIFPNGELSVLVNKTNLGFAEGNNIGIRYALKKGADYVMILNNDTVVDRNLIVGLLDVFRKIKKVGVVSPKIYFAKGFEFHKDRYKKSDLGKVIWYAGGDIDWNNVYATNLGVDEVDEEKFSMTKETDFATGACSLFYTKALKDTGLYDKRYFAYFEDVELSERLKRKGWKVIYSSNACLWHKVAGSSGIGSDLNDYFITRNRMLFGIVYASLRTKVALIKESVKLLISGREWQKIGVRDYYLGKYGKGSWR